MQRSENDNPMKVRTTTVIENTVSKDNKIEHVYAGNKNSVQDVYQAISEHLCCELNGEAVILSLKNGNYYGLNAVGARIWELVQEPVSLSKIEKVILSEYEVDSDECRQEIGDFLTLMNNEGLLEVTHEQVTQIYKTASGRKDSIY